jgi:hypothetical protein
MIGKITKGNGFTGVCKYVLDKDEARLIGGNMASTTPRQLAAEFRVFSQKNQRVQLPVEHISLSPSPLDRELDDSEWEALAIDLLDGLGMNMNQYIVVLHNDTEFEGKPRPHSTPATTFARGLFIRCVRLTYRGKLIFKFPLK